jgi:predicted nucleic acid-binding protein
VAPGDQPDAQARDAVQALAGASGSVFQKMSRVFADTFYFLALTNPRDQAHARVVQWTLGFQGDMVATAWVLTEFGNHMSSIRNRQEFINTVRDLRVNGQVTILNPTTALFEEGLKLYENRTDKNWSLTDCISFVAMQQEGLTDALTGDHHFEQAGFVGLFK